MERVEYMLQSQINRQLAGHGGRVSLMEITEDGYAILQFGGGCNGCSMVDVTLKEGIEKQLLNEFPELKVCAISPNTSAANTPTTRLSPFCRLPDATLKRHFGPTLNMCQTLAQHCFGKSFLVSPR